MVPAPLVAWQDNILFDHLKEPEVPEPVPEQEGDEEGQGSCDLIGFCTHSLQRAKANGRYTYSTQSNQCTLHRSGGNGTQEEETDKEDKDINRTQAASEAKATSMLR